MRLLVVDDDHGGAPEIEILKVLPNLPFIKALD
jgi:hypothetical protein